METNYTEVLFILALYEEGAELDKLIYHLEGDGEVTNEARAKALGALMAMEKKGLVTLGVGEGVLITRLTESGRELSGYLADKRADEMIRDWYSQSLVAP